MNQLFSGVFCNGSDNGTIRGLQFYKIAGILAADRTDKVRRQCLGLQNISANRTAPSRNIFCVCLIGRSLWRSGPVFLQMVIGIGERRCLGIQDFCFHYLAHYNHMGAHIHGGYNTAGETGTDTFCGIWIIQAVPSLWNAVIFLYILAALEAETSNQVHFHIVGKYRCGKGAGCLYQLQRIVFLVESNG